MSELGILKHHYLTVKRGCQIVQEVSPSLNKGGVGVGAPRWLSRLSV